MVTRIINGRAILPEKISESYIYIKKGKILAVTDEELDFDNEVDAKGNYVSAGFIDIHVHGGDGYEFVDATKEAVKNAANLHAKHGTTTIYPTISAYDYKKMVSVLSILKKHKDDSDIIPNIYGVHLEGPYLSPKQGGAQDPSCIKLPNADEYFCLFDNYGDIIKRWSYAPEISGADDFLDFLNKNSIIASAGHTDAEYDDIKKAYDRGLKLITHFYSCMSTITRKKGFRILGVIETAYLYDDIDVEIIADACHLPPELLQLIYKIKGDKHTCLVTDSIRYGGMSNADGKEYTDDGIPYIIEDGVAKLADRSAFAGSIATSDILIRNCVKRAGIPLISAVKMMTEVPAKIMGLNRKGRLQEGYDADVVIFDEDINIKKVFVAKGEFN